MTLKLFTLTIFIFSLIAFSTVTAQEGRRSGGGRGGRMPEGGPQIQGQVVDEPSGSGIEYASVVLYKSEDSSMFKGTVTDAKGNYALSGVRRGKYYIEVRFMGYESKIIDDVRLTALITKLDPIAIVPAAIEMDEIEVATDRAPVTYMIDKKIINVERQLTATSGSAVDVLMNVPSVTVDLDGNVSLRGSGSFNVLIDGRPSILDGSEALEQIPASSIENIEIITNPSAKYDPEGVSGIINVIMKKEGKSGTTGVFNINIGTQDQYGADATITQRNDWYTVYLGADFRQRGGKSTSEERSEFVTPNGSIAINSDGKSDRGHDGYGMRSGVDLTLSKSDNLGIGIRYGHREGGGTSELDYEESRDGGDPMSYISKSDHTRGGAFYSGNVDYEHRFGSTKHKLNAQISIRGREGEEKSLDELFDETGNISSGRESTEDGPGRMMDARLDYLRPLGENYSLETGYQNRRGSSDDITTFSEYDPASGTYIQQTEFDRSTTYSRDVHALYAMSRGELGAFGIQLGLRGEYTNREVDAGASGTFKIDRWDYFPTVHTSYRITETQQFMGSYSRRINRPRGWYLEPFLTWTDAYNVRSGNPDLQPEYIDSWEFGYQTHIGKNMLSIEGYHRVTKNNIERVRSVYQDNITLWEVENVGQETSSGVELMFNVDPVSMWDVYLLGNLYNYKVVGDLNGNSIDAERFTWNLRFNNTFKITQATILQLNARYNSPSVSAQSRTEDFYTVDLALRQDLFQRKLALTLNWRDVFHTAKRESTTEGIDFTSYRYSLRDAPMISLSIKYFLNTTSNEEKRQPRNGGDMGEDDF
jgi:outer membrane cobalamin receptor